jgi:hypothetical protein
VRRCTHWEIVFFSFFSFPYDRFRGEIWNPVKEEKTISSGFGMGRKNEKKKKKKIWWTPTSHRTHARIPGAILKCVRLRERERERERERKGAGDLKFKNTPKGMLTFQVFVCVRMCVEKMKGFITHTHTHHRQWFNSGLKVTVQCVYVCTNWKYFCFPPPITQLLELNFLQQ